MQFDLGNQLQNESAVAPDAGDGEHYKGLIVFMLSSLNDPALPRWVL
jgi:hypothetical protein